MLNASSFRAEKGRTNLTIDQIAKGSDVSPNTIVRLLDSDRNSTVTLAKARKVMNYLKGLLNGDRFPIVTVKNGDLEGIIIDSDAKGFNLFAVVNNKSYKIRFDVIDGLISKTSQTELK